MTNSPKARYENIVVQDLKNETLVCDLKTNRVFCLNETAGEVWKLCNGKNDIAEIERILSRKLGGKVGQEIILLALDEFSKENLLAENFSTKAFYTDVSRREMIRKAGMVSMLALPLVSSVMMPTSAQAASGSLSAFGGPCTFNSDCQSGLGCLSGTCLRLNAQFCSLNSECQSGFCTDNVCCESSCSGTCEKCNQVGFLGFCDAIPNGTDPDNECPSGSGLAGVCNGARACR